MAATFNSQGMPRIGMASYPVLSGFAKKAALNSVSLDTVKAIEIREKEIAEFSRIGVLPRNPRWASGYERHLTGSLAAIGVGAPLLTAYMVPHIISSTPINPLIAGGIVLASSSIGIGVGSVIADYSTKFTNWLDTKFAVDGLMDGLVSTDYIIAEIYAKKLDEIGRKEEALAFLEDVILNSGNPSVVDQAIKVMINWPGDSKPGFRKALDLYSYGAHQAQNSGLEILSYKELKKNLSTLFYDLVLNSDNPEELIDYLKVLNDKKLNASHGNRYLDNDVFWSSLRGKDVEYSMRAAKYIQGIIVNNDQTLFDKLEDEAFETRKLIAKFSEKVIRSVFKVNHTVIRLYMATSLSYLTDSFLIGVVSGYVLSSKKGPIPGSTRIRVIEVIDQWATAEFKERVAEPIARCMTKDSYGVNWQIYEVSVVIAKFLAQFKNEEIEKEVAKHNAGALGFEITKAFINHPQGLVVQRLLRMDPTVQAQHYRELEDWPNPEDTLLDVAYRELDPDGPNLNRFINVLFDHLDDDYMPVDFRLKCFDMLVKLARYNTDIIPEILYAVQEHVEEISEERKKDPSDKEMREMIYILDKFLLTMRMHSLYNLPNFGSIREVLEEVVSDKFSLRSDMRFDLATRSLSIAAKIVAEEILGLIGPKKSEPFF